MHAFIVRPPMYHSFENEEEQLEQCKEWGLLSDKAAKIKAYAYKGSGLNLPCTIVGYVDKMTAVIAFENGELHCIHPSYLKEMQASGYGQRVSYTAEALAVEDDGESDAARAENDQTGSEGIVSGSDKGASEQTELEQVTFEELLPVGDAASDDSGHAEGLELNGTASARIGGEQAHAGHGTLHAAEEAEEPRQLVLGELGIEERTPAPVKAAKEKQPRKVKLKLPEAKVKMTATVKEFTTVPNHFADADDEVIIYEQAAITEPGQEQEVGDIWSSHSATLKKLELEVGDVLTFEAKIVAKKLTRHPVPYKINNPSKMKKEG